MSAKYATRRNAHLINVACRDECGERGMLHVMWAVIEKLHAEAAAAAASGAGAVDVRLLMAAQRSKVRWPFWGLCVSKGVQGACV